MEKYQHLSQKERLKLYGYYQDGLSVRQIADRLNRSPSTVSRELRRNKIRQGYLPDTAHKLYHSRYRGRPRRINPDRGSVREADVMCKVTWLLYNI